MPVNTKHWDVYYAQIIEQQHPFAKKIIKYLQDRVEDLQTANKLYATNNFAFYKNDVYQNTYQYFWHQIKENIDRMSNNKQKKYYQKYQNQQSYQFKTEINYYLKEHLANYTFGIHTNDDFNFAKYIQFYQQRTEHLNISVISKTDVFKIIKMYEQQCVKVLNQ